MSIDITSAKDAVQDQGLKILIHGMAGAGKTRLCATTGDLDHTLIISAEGGLLSLREYDIDTVTIDDLKGLREVYSYLKSGDHEYRWVCLDSISEIAEVVLGREKRATNDGRRAYGEMADIMFTVLRNFRNLPYHVVMTAKQGREEDDGRMLYVPSLPGRQLTQNIAYVFDEVFALVADRGTDGSIERYLVTQRDGRHEAKDRSGALELHERADLRHIHDKIRGEGTPLPDPATQSADRLRELAVESMGDEGAAILEGAVCDLAGVDALADVPLDKLRTIVTKAQTRPGAERERYFGSIVDKASEEAA